jgi:two-component system, NtrC family, sensor kinase
MNDRNEMPPQNNKPTLNLAIVGGGNASKFFLNLLQEKPFPNLNLTILGVCDIDPQAEGIRMAREMGIYTTSDFRDLFKLPNLDALIELTNSPDVLLDLVRLKPSGIGILDHNVSRFLSVSCETQKISNAAHQATLEQGVCEFLIQQTNERIVVLTSDFKIVEANGPYFKAVGKSREEVIGAYCYNVTHGLTAPCSMSQPELGCPLVETLRTGESAHVIHEHPTQEGRATYCDTVTYPLKNRSKEIVGIIEVWSDITEQMTSRWEGRISKLKADMGKLIQEDRMISLGKLVASSVHEINNPIQGLLTFSRLMEKTLEKGQPGPDDMEDFRTYLPLMTSELERCGKIISGLLSFARHSKIEYKNTDVNEVLKQVLTLSRHKMEIQNVRLDLELAPEPLIVEGDVNQLQQCFLDIIFNAIEAMPQGGELSVTSEWDAPSNKAFVTVRDTGYGISEKNLDHIFDPFFTTKQEGNGTGLGLSIVHGVVKGHKGAVRVESKEGKGTSFTLSFPCP